MILTYLVWNKLFKKSMIDNIISKSMPEQKVPKNPAMDLFYSMEEPSSIKLTKRAILSSLKNQATTKILQKIDENNNLNNQEDNEESFKNEREGGLSNIYN